MKVLGIICLLILLSSPGNINAGGRNGQWDAGPTEIIYPFKPEFEVVSYEKSTGDITLKMTVTYLPEARLKPTCDMMVMPVYTFHGMKYNGPDTLYIPYRTENPYSTILELNAPLNDTGYLIIRSECDSMSRQYDQAFITTGDTLVRRWDGGGYGMDFQTDWTDRQHPKPREDYERAKREWEEKQKLQKEAHKRVKGHGIRISPEDSVLFGDLSEKDKKKLYKMRLLEHEPLSSGASHESFVIGGRHFIRRRGETKFHETEPVTDVFAHSLKVRDSINASSNKDYHIKIKITNQTDSEFVAGLVDSMRPTEPEGYYSTTVKWPVIKKLKEAGIEIRKGSWMPGQKKVPVNELQKSKKKKKKINAPPEIGSIKGHRSNNPLDVLFYEGFEGYFPGNIWNVGDLDSWNYADYWGDVSCRSRSGIWSVWCSAEGNMPICNYYDYYMESYMYMNNPVDLSDYENVEVDYSIWYETEDYYDYIAVYYSYNGGQTWEMSDFFSGNSSGWDDQWFPYSDDQVQLKFVFLALIRQQQKRVCT